MPFEIPKECHVCKKTFSGYIPAQQHFGSEEHKKKLDVMKQEGKGATCYICNVNCDTLKILQQHTQSPRHLANAEKQRQFEQYGNSLTTDALNYIEMYGGQSEVYKFSLISKTGCCYVCNITLNSVSHAESHINGKLHKKRSGQFEAMKAAANFTPQNISSANQNDYQRSVMNAVPSRSGTTVECISSQNIHTSTTNPSSNSRYCEICGVSFTGQSNAQQHYSSEKHKKKVTQANQGLGKKPSYFCSLCNIPFTGPENEEIHKMSQKHLKIVKLMEKRERGEELPLSCNACSCKFTGQENAESHFKGSKHKRNIENMNIRSGGLNADQGMSVQSAQTANIAKRPEVVSEITQRESAFTRNVSNSNNRGHVNQNISQDIQEVKGNGVDEEECADDFLIRPAQQREGRSGKESTEDSLVVKPIENDNNSLVIKPVEDETPPITQNRETDDESLDIKTIETDITTFDSLTDELKIRKETSIEPSADTLSLESGDFSSRDTEPVRYVRNELGYSVTPMGRGRGIFSIFMKNEDKLPGKVVNMDTCHRDKIVQKVGFGDNETVKKSVWEGTRAAPQSEIPVNDTKFEESHSYEDTHQPQSNNKFPVNIISISSNNENRGDDLIQRKPSGSECSYEMKEYVFDTFTERGRCNVCDIDLTSSAHKSQHILGKKHLKAREVRKQMTNAGGFVNSNLICEICSVTFSGFEAKEQHMASEKHKQKERRLLTGEENDFFCDICKVSCTGPDSLLQHQMGAQHKKMAGISAADYSGMQATSFDQTQWFPCEVCKCSLNTYEQLEIHKKSPKHLKQLEKQLSGGLPNATGDNTQWYPCHVCNCSMNTYEQLQIHVQSPKHFKQLEKHSSDGQHNLGGDGTQWYPCRVCNCSMNTLEQLQIHEKSPKHLKQLEKQQVSRLQKSNLITQTGPSNIVFTPLNKSGSTSVSDTVTPLESFLSEELFPEEFLPTSGPSVNKCETTKLTNDFEEKLVMTDEPFYIPEHLAGGGMFQVDVYPGGRSGDTGGTKRGQGSDLAWATRNRGAHDDRSKKASSRASSEEYDLQGARPKQSGSSPATTSYTDPRVNNPYAATHPYYCHACKAPMNTKESYEMHLKGKRHMQKVCTEPAPQRSHHLPQRLPVDYVPFTLTHPRNYQQELHKKAMADDTLCFLPTGTGKTLVAVMTVSAMLEKYPSKIVLFLVDKVLLVLQQSKYIRKEIGDKEYDRFNPDNATSFDIVRRTPRIAAVCMDQQTTQGVPLWKHDIVVVTAAFCKNLLDREILRWEDFSLVVFDEAHHCEKGHPFNSLLTNYHKRASDGNKPKILGLTASPAGKADVPKTLQMLRGLVANMGDVCMAIVEEHENVDTLNEYQSNAEMIIRSHIDTSDSLEANLKHELNVYIMHCVLTLYQISNITFYVDFDRELNASMTEKDVRSIADNFICSHFDMIQLSLNMIESKDNESISKGEFFKYRMHMQSVCMALSCLEEGGALIAMQEMEDMEDKDYNFGFARGVGMPTAYLQQMLSRKGQGLGGQSSRGDDATTDFHIKRLINELTDCGTSAQNENKKRMSLVLVKQRRTAHLIARVLQNTERMRQLGLNTTCVVGHGGSGSTDKGMNVNQQKRVLEEIKQYKYQVIVATSVAEEGVDWPECERVISLYPPSTVTALVQMRGRARRKNSKFVVLCSSKEEEGTLYDIMQREENMINATRILIELDRDAKR